MKAYFTGGIMNRRVKEIDEAPEKLVFYFWYTNGYMQKGIRREYEYVKSCEMNLGKPIVFYNLYIKPVEPISEGLGSLSALQRAGLASRPAYPDKFFENITRGVLG